MLPFFFFNDTATTEIYTLSLHDALPIFGVSLVPVIVTSMVRSTVPPLPSSRVMVKCSTDRKSTRLYSTHQIATYAVFCFTPPRPPTVSVATLALSVASAPAHAAIRQLIL